jgi:exodeoxyribonuclease V beta subunit
VEFAHPIQPIFPAQLQTLFAQHGSGGAGSGGAREIPADFPARLGRLQFRPLEGFMRGFIDLLFEFEGRYYLLDWKSNWLGERIGHYNQTGMRACMLHHTYFLQYHLYTLATDLFLRSRIPNYDYEQHFGGVIYVFLRGVDPSRPDCGSFCDRPDGQRIAALRQTLIGGGL